MFDAILRELLTKVPGARGAVFCDYEGETVVSVGTSGATDHEVRDDYNLRVAGAQFATPLISADERKDSAMGRPRECVISGEREKLVVHMLPDHYYLILCLDPGALVGRSLVHVREVAEVLAKEIT